MNTHVALPSAPAAVIELTPEQAAAVSGGLMKTNPYEITSQIPHAPHMESFPYVETTTVPPGCD